MWFGFYVCKKNRLSSDQRIFGNAAFLLSSHHSLIVEHKGDLDSVFCPCDTSSDARGAAQMWLVCSCGWRAGRVMNLSEIKNIFRLCNLKYIISQPVRLWTVVKHQCEDVGNAGVYTSRWTFFMCLYHVFTVCLKNKEMRQGIILCLLLFLLLNN